MNLTKKFYSNRLIVMTFPQKLLKSIAQIGYGNTIVDRALSFIYKLVNVLPYTAFSCLYRSCLYLKNFNGGISHKYNC